ncbi:MAG: DUF1028 domain-containing protein [bacterium]
MKSLLVVVSLVLFSSLIAQAQIDDLAAPLRPVNTYSIVAYDAVTGQFGAAVQSHYFRVANVIWLEPKVGAVATQSLVDFSYGPLGLEMMRLGKSSQQALDGLLASDPQNEVRQVAMIDRNGEVATHTGSGCIAYAGHQQGRHYSVQANLMRNNTVPAAMAEAFEKTQGDLAERLMAALEAAEAEGGDIRGKQSAALVVVSGEPTGQSWKDRLFDIRVDDSPEPLVELRRLLNLSRAYDFMDLGDIQMAQKDLVGARAYYEIAAAYAPDNPEILFWHAVALATAKDPGTFDDALDIFARVFAADKSWRELIPRLVDAKLLPDNQETIKRIMAQ